MKFIEVRKTHEAITSWCNGEGNLVEVCRLLGDKRAGLSQMLLDNLIAGPDFRVMPDISPSDAGACIYLYLAMRNT